MPHAHDSPSPGKPYTRAQALRSGWHYLYVFIGAAASAAVLAAILLPFYVLRRSLVPPDAFLWGGTRSGNIFLWIPPMFSALAIGMTLGRFVVRRIPTARTVLESELGDHTKTVSSLNRYAKWGRLALTGALPLCYFGAMSTWATTPARIVIRPIFSATVHFYDWSSVTAIETGCTQGRRSTSFHFVLSLADSTRVDLMENDEWAFWAAYPKIQLALTGHSYGFSAGFVRAPCGYAAPSWQRILSQPPTDPHSSN